MHSLKQDHAEFTCSRPQVPIRLGVLRRTASAALKTLFYPFVRHQRRLLWEADLDQVRPASTWSENERVLVLSSGNLDQFLTPELKSFLGAEENEIEGVRQGDCLFVLASGSTYLASSFIFFNTTAETKRQSQILNEPSFTPIIGQSFTAPLVRGRGIYRKLLNEMFVFLSARGYPRVVCEIDPENTPSIHASEAVGMQALRELHDWILLKSLLIQKCREANKTRWRVVLLPRGTPAR